MSNQCEITVKLMCINDQCLIQCARNLGKATGKNDKIKQYVDTKSAIPLRWKFRLSSQPDGFHQYQCQRSLISMWEIPELEDEQEL